MKSVSMSIPTTRVTPITEQQLWLTVCVKNWGVACSTPAVSATVRSTSAGKYTLTGSAQKSTSEALPEALREGP